MIAWGRNSEGSLQPRDLQRKISIPDSNKTSQFTGFDSQMQIHFSFEILSRPPLFPRSIRKTTKNGEEQKEKYLTSWKGYWNSKLKRLQSGRQNFSASQVKTFVQQENLLERSFYFLFEAVFHKLRHTRTIEWMHNTRRCKARRTYSNPFLCTPTSLYNPPCKCNSRPQKEASAFTSHSSHYTQTVVRMETQFVPTFSVKTRCTENYRTETPTATKQPLFSTSLARPIPRVLKSEKHPLPGAKANCISQRAKPGVEIGWRNEGKKEETVERVHYSSRRYRVDARASSGVRDARSPPCRSLIYSQVRAGSFLAREIRRNA